MTGSDESYSDIHRLIDRAHRETTEADEVPAFVWSRVRAETKANVVEENPAMSMNLAISSPLLDSPRLETGGLQRFSGMVATLAIVAILAFGGWFAAMNLPPANDGQRLAVMQSTPMAAATCDVEPLTVEQVMSIVRNPIVYMYDGPAAPPVVYSDEGIAKQMEENSYRMPIPTPVDAGRSVLLTEEQFANASDTADAYLSCLISGTQAQVWNFYHPAAIQATILAQFPVYVSEEEVRLYVEERLNQPALEGDVAWAWLPFIDDVTSARINPDMQLTISRDSQLDGVEMVVYAGVVIETANEGVIVRTNGSGINLIPNDMMLTGKNDIVLRLTLVKPRFSDVWMIIPYPTIDEMMRNLPPS